MRLWDSPNPYAEDVNEVDKEKWLPIFEGIKEKYNVDFEFYTTTTEWCSITPMCPSACPKVSWTACPICS